MMEGPYRSSVVLIVDRPPSAKEFFVVHYTDTALKVPIGRHILVMAARGTIVRKAQAVPTTEMGVQEALICAVKAYASLCECQQSIVVAQIRLQGQHPLLKQSGHPISGTPAKFASTSNNSSGARRVTTSASRYTRCSNCVCRHSAILVKVETRSGRFMRYRFAGDLLTIRSTGMT